MWVYWDGHSGMPCVTLDGSIPRFALMMQNCNTPSETSWGEISFWSMTLLLLAKKAISFVFPWSKINEKILFFVVNVKETKSEYDYKSCTSPNHSSLIFLLRN